MIPYDYQIELAKQGTKVLKEHMLVYLACEERTGKTLASILIAEAIKVKTVLVVTKKNALKGWNETIEAYKPNRQITITNYHQVNKLKKKFDLVILDEAHNYISSFPKTSKIWEAVQRLCINVPIIYISATPYAQGYQLLYHQLALSSWSPWTQYLDAHSWFGKFGIPKTIWTAYGQVPQYTETLDDCFEEVKHLFITKTRAELGFEHEPEDKVHYVELGKATKQVYNTLTNSKAIVLNGWDLVCDSVMKLRTSLHMIEGGVMLVSTPIKDSDRLKRNYIQLGNTEKIDYIKKHWGDLKTVVIMYNYIAEKTKLQKAFKNATILQATSFAEGVDLSSYEHLVIYSQDFSTARHTQRRARQANKNRSKPIIVHFLLIKDAISEQVYTTVSVNKKNYIDSLYKPKLL